MRQVAITRYGAPEVLQIREREDPQAGPGEVRIRVRAAGVNFSDVLARMGLYQDAPPLPAVVGYEVAGVVDATGHDVTAVGPGDRVTALIHFGGYSDCVVCPVHQVFPTPPSLSDAEAAAIPVTYITAALALYRLANVTAGETVLVHNAGGGVGTAAIQLAQLRRATVIGTASGSKHVALRGFGVEHLIDYRHANVEREVRQLTRGRGVDVVLDPLGAESFAASYRMLAPLGRLIVYGMSAAAPGLRRNLFKAVHAWWRTPSFTPLSLLNRNRAVMGLHLGHLWSEHSRLDPIVRLLIEEFRSERLKPVVARTFPLEQAADAHRFIQSRGNIGKVILVT